MNPWPDRRARSTPACGADGSFDRSANTSLHSMLGSGYTVIRAAGALSHTGSRGSFAILLNDNERLFGGPPARVMFLVKNNNQNSTRTLLFLVLCPLSASGIVDARAQYSKSAKVETCGRQ